jgi:hypothetical protein
LQVVFYRAPSVTQLLNDFDRAEREAGIAIVNPDVALRKYLDSLWAAGDALPLRNGGRPNILAVARACDFDRYHFRRDPRLIEMPTAFMKET